jgi:hypothetical protein
MMEREAAYLNKIVTDASYATEVRVFDAGRSLTKRFRKNRQILFKEKKALIGFYSS